MALAEESVALRPLDAPRAGAGPSDSLEPPPLVLGHRRPGLWNEDDEEFFRRMFWPEYAPLQPRQHPPQEQQHSLSPALPGHKSPLNSPISFRAHPHAPSWALERIPRERRHELNLSPRPRLRTRESARARLGSRWPARVSSFTENRISPLSGSSSTSSGGGGCGSECDEASDSSNSASCSGSSHAGATCCCAGSHSSGRCSSASSSSSTNMGAETTLTVSHIASNCGASNCLRSMLEQDDSPVACFCHIFPSSSSAGWTRGSACCTKRCATPVVPASPVLARARNSRPVRARGDPASSAGASAATIVTTTSISCGSGSIGCSVCVTGVGCYGSCCNTAAAVAAAAAAAAAADMMQRSSSYNTSTAPALLQSPGKSILVSSSTSLCQPSRTGSADKKVRFLVPGTDTETYTNGMLVPPRTASIPAAASETLPHSSS